VSRGSRALAIGLDGEVVLAGKAAVPDSRPTARQHRDVDTEAAVKLLGQHEEDVVSGTVT
jgi:hypothetical protein